MKIESNEDSSITASIYPNPFVGPSTTFASSYLYFNDPNIMDFFTSNQCLDLRMEFHFVTVIRIEKIESATHVKLFHIFQEGADYKFELDYVYADDSSNGRFELNYSLFSVHSDIENIED